LATSGWLYIYVDCVVITFFILTNDKRLRSQSADGYPITPLFASNSLYFFLLIVKTFYDFWKAFCNVYLNLDGVQFHEMARRCFDRKVSSEKVFYHFSFLSIYFVWPGLCSCLLMECNRTKSWNMIDDPLLLEETNNVLKGLTPAPTDIWLMNFL
jgi:hypothetical protein